MLRTMIPFRADRWMTVHSPGAIASDSPGEVLPVFLSLRERSWSGLWTALSRSERSTERRRGMRSRFAE